VGEEINSQKGFSEKDFLVTGPTLVMTMILRELSFPVREATIFGYLLNPDWLDKYGRDEYQGLAWEVIVQTEELMIDEEYYAEPRLTCGEFSLPIRRWPELEGQIVRSGAARGPGAPVALS
jgi:hypothetical protein